MDPSIGRRGATHFDSTFRRLLSGANVTKTDSYIRCQTGEPHPLGNLVVFRDEGNPDPIPEAVRPLAEGGVPSAAVFLSAPPANVEAVLEEAGYQFAASMPVMAVTLDELATPKLPEGYDFSRIESVDAATDWTDCLAKGYGLPHGLAELFRPDGQSLFGESPAQWFAVARNGKIVAVSMLTFEDGLAGVYCVATLEEERGKGLGAYVTAEPLRMAIGMGFETGVLQSSELGLPVYQRLGFREFAQMPMYLRMV